MEGLPAAADEVDIYPIVGAIILFYNFTPFNSVRGVAVVGDVARHWLRVACA